MRQPAGGGDKLGESRAIAALQQFDDLRDLGSAARRDWGRRDPALGEWDAARDAIAEAVANAPGLTTEFVESQELYRDREVKRRLLDLLVEAGLRPQRVSVGSMVAAHSK